MDVIVLSASHVQSCAWHCRPDYLGGMGSAHSDSEFMPSTSVGKRVSGVVPIPWEFRLYDFNQIHVSSLISSKSEGNAHMASPGLLAKRCCAGSEREYHSAWLRS